MKTTILLIAVAVFAAIALVVAEVVIEEVCRRRREAKDRAYFKRIGEKP